MQAHIPSLHTPSTHGVGSKVFSSSESSHVAYPIKAKGSIDQHRSKTLTLHTPLTSLGWVERSDIEFVQISIFFIELSTKHIPNKKRNAPLRTVQLSGKSQVIGQFNLYQCKGMSVTAASHVFCNQVSKLC